MRVLTLADRQGAPDGSFFKDYVIGNLFETKVNKNFVSWKETPTC